MATDTLIRLDDSDTVLETELSQQLSPARSTVSNHSVVGAVAVEDGAMSGHQLRKKKGNTLSRLKKLKKQPEALPPELKQDLLAPKRAKDVNGQPNAALLEYNHERKYHVERTHGDGSEETASSQGRAILQGDKPSPLPRLKPINKPLRNLVDDDSPLEQKCHLVESSGSSYCRPLEIYSMDGSSESNLFYEKSVRTSKDARHAPTPEVRRSPRVKPRQFGNIEKHIIDIKDTKEASDTRTEQTECSPSVTEAIVKQMSEFDEGFLQPAPSSSSCKEHVSVLPPVCLTRTELNDSVKQAGNLTSSIRNESAEIVLNKSEILQDFTIKTDRGLDDLSDSDDLIVVPNRKSEIKLSAINEPISSSSSNDVSKLLYADDAAPLVPSPLDTKRDHWQSSDEDDIVVSTFGDQIEEVIVPTQVVPDESAIMSRLPSDKQSLDDDMLRSYAQSLKDVLQESSQTRRKSGDSVRPSTPVLLDSQPSSSTWPHNTDDMENSVAFSEPIFSSASTSESQLLDSSRSSMSTSALSTITTRKARNKSFSIKGRLYFWSFYLSGGASAAGSLLSKEELDRFFPDRKVKIFIATWNMCEGKVIPDNLEELLLPEECILVQDMYVIGTQESYPDGQEWEISLQETLGPSHVLLHSASYGVLRLLIFIRRDLVWFCSVVEEDTVSTRAFSMIKTKGAVAAGFTFFGTSFLFINSHFTAGDEQIKERINDYEKIIKELQLPVKVPPTRKYNTVNTDVTSRFDCIFWCGDFNFRLAETRLKIENWAGKLRDGKEKDYDILLRYDQLKKAMIKKSIFRSFQEGDIHFLPTYKYDIGGDIYDSSVKSRVPSYTDRILYKSRRKSGIQNILYNSCNSIKVSDHRPVYSMYEAIIKPGKDDSLTSGGVFSRDVFIEANRRRAIKSKLSGVYMSQKSSTICSVM